MTTTLLMVGNWVVMLAAFGVGIWILVMTVRLAREAHGTLEWTAIAFCGLMSAVDFAIAATYAYALRIF